LALDTSLQTTVIAGGLDTPTRDLLRIEEYWDVDRGGALAAAHDRLEYCPAKVWIGLSKRPY
jgi:hypothetical protein